MNSTIYVNSTVYINNTVYVNSNFAMASEQFHEQYKTASEQCCEIVKRLVNSVMNNKTASEQCHE